MPLLLRRLPERDEITILHEGRPYAVALRRRAGATRLTLRVSSATGAVVLTVPPHVGRLAASAFADRHGGWIVARLARIPDRITIALGTTVPLRGVPHVVAAGTITRGGAKAVPDEGCTPVILVGGGPEIAGGRVRRFLAGEAQADLLEAVARHTAALGVPARRIAVRDTRSRWGSCSSSGALSFSWRLVMAPPFVLDYLAAHEVAHLKELNHSARFWRLTRALCPATDEAETWLKRHGRELHRYA